jgi:hypothetical protein
MQNDAKQFNTLQARIDRAATKLAALKAKQQAREARERTKRVGEARAARNRALVLLGVALERETLALPERINEFRSILERHLTRENERSAALDFLNSLGHAVPAQIEKASVQNGMSAQ